MSTPRLLLESAADRLPTPNGVALAIMKLWDDDNTTVEQLTRLIQTDPALCGRLLRLANSAAMGSRRVAAVPEAIVRVGMRTVGQIAVTFSLIESSRDGQCEAFDYPLFWSRCLLMAVLARALAAVTRVTAPDDMFACALLSRIGQLAFATIYPAEYSALLEGSAESLLTEERRSFGFDHNELSFELMRDFGVPDVLATPARHHEDPKAAGFAESSRERRLTDVLHLAYVLSELALSGENSNIRGHRHLHTYAARLEMESDNLANLFDAGIADWQDWSQILELPMTFEGDYDAISNEDSAGQPPPDAADVQAGEVDEVVRFRCALLGTGAHILDFSERLVSAEFTVRLCADEASALHAAVSLRPQLLVVDGCDPALNAEHFCRLVRSTEWGAATHVIVVVPQGQSDMLVALFSAGADSVVDDTISEEEFSARLQAIQRYLGLQVAWQRDRAQLKRIANELTVSHYKVEQLSLTDQLTKLPNRRAAMTALEQAWCMSERSGTPMAVAMMDMDYFKSINDRFGHGVGDEVLRATAKVMVAAVRREETMARFGGEEFLLVSPGNELKPMIVAAERLRRQVEALTINHGKGTINPTLSMGVVQRAAGDADINALLSAADKALYHAKDAGRNIIGYRANGRFGVAGKR